MTPFEQGIWAASSGQSASECPYHKASTEAKDWLAGWELENDAIIDGENLQEIADNE